MAAATEETVEELMEVLGLDVGEGAGIEIEAVVAELAEEAADESTSPRSPRNLPLVAAVTPRPQDRALTGKRKPVSLHYWPFSKPS